MIARVQDALTPEIWCERLRERGASVSARKLRSKARATGQYYALGRTMLLHPDHIEALMAPDAGDAPDRSDT